MAQIKGAALVAKCLQQQGIREVFGLVGYPVVEVAHRVQELGLTYVGTRHEQAAAYAAQAAAYLRGHVGVALTVSGPGMTNALTALGNAQANCWPMVLIGGSSDLRTAHRGGFQEAPQLDAARPFCKWIGQVTDAHDIPRFIEHAVRQAWYGRPGPVYLDLPADIIDSHVEADELSWPAAVPPPPRTGAPPERVAEAMEVLRGAARPLLIVGKGAAWADAAPELRRLVDKTGLPFLPSPMGKGVLPDDHPASVAAARSHALQHADTILLAGARLNWIMHFGMPPRFRPDVKVVQIDAAPEELGTNVPAAVGLAGDLKAVGGQMAAHLEEHPWQVDGESAWKRELAAQVAKKKEQLHPALTDEGVPMGYYRPLQEIQNLLPRDALLVTEGSNTMDISRSVLEAYHPRQRLDAGTWGTMGVGPGYALAAATVHPDKRVVALLGDGAFGFSGMEVEVSMRYRLPITWIVFTNNGIGTGVPELPADAPPPVHVYLPDARYERIIEAFGGRGYYCQGPAELAGALKEALASPEATLINVKIEPSANRAPQTFSWLTR